MAPQVSAIVLAAGLSKRIGQIKQLLPLGNTTVIRYCIDSIISAGLKDIVVVVAPNSKGIRKEIKNLPIRIATNNMPESEMAESVRIGLGMVKNNSTGILICLSDHPLVSPDTLKALIDAHTKEPDKLIIPSFDNKRGHPSLFPKILLKDLFAGLNLREIINKNSQQIQHLNVPDEGVVFDIDTLDDYQEILIKLSNSKTIKYD